MSRPAGRWVGLLAAMLGVVASLAAPAAAAPTPAPAPTPVGKISQLHVEGDHLEVLFSALGLPAGATIDPASVGLVVDGRTLDATAKPVAGTAPSAVVQRSAMLVLDVSGSMRGPGLAGAQQAATAFLKSVPGDVKVGLVLVSDTASVAVQPTTERTRIRSVVAGLSANGNTALYDGISLALKTLGSSGSRTLVLLTDGRDDGSKTTLAEAVAEAKASDAVVDAVSLGVAGAQIDPLKQLTTATDGRLLATTDASDLAASFAQAARDIATQVLITAPLPDSIAAGGQDLSVAVTAMAAGVYLSDSALLPVPAMPAPKPTTAAGSGPQPVAIHVAWAAHGPVLWIALALLLLGLVPLIAFAIRRAGIHEYPLTRVRRRLSFYTLGGRRPGAVSGAADGDDDLDAARDPSGGDPFGGGDFATGEHDVGRVRAAVVRAARLTVSGNRERQLSLRLDAAGVPLKPPEWTVVQVAAPLAVGLLFLLLSAADPVPVIVGLVLGALAPPAYLSAKQSRRSAAFLTQLPETLQLIAGSLSVGHSLPQALDTVVRESTAPVSTEFNRALVESRLGVPIEEALDGIADRMGSQDFRWVVMAVRIQREVGGNLSEILATVAATLRDRDRLRRQVKVLSAEGRLSAWILGAMPPLFALYLITTRPGYIRPLLHDSLGIAMLIIAIGLMAIGVIWLRKVVRVEV